MSSCHTVYKLSIFFLIFVFSFLHGAAVLMASSEYKILCYEIYKFGKRCRLLSVDWSKIWMKKISPIPRYLLWYILGHWQKALMQNYWNVVIICIHDSKKILFKIFILNNCWKFNKTSYACLQTACIYHPGFIKMKTRAMQIIFWFFIKLLKPIVRSYRKWFKVSVKTAHKRSKL